MSALCGLMSLYDMLKVHAHSYVRIGQMANEFAGLLYMSEHELDDPGRPLTADQIQSLIAHITELALHCDLLGLKVAKQSMERAKKDPPQNSREYDAHLAVLTDELRSQLFLFVPTDRAPYYEQSMLFGEGVNDKFPKAIGDIEDAGKALAVGLGTSCVMHLMRVMEEGLKSLALQLKIPYAPSWESYLKQIQLRIDSKRKTKGIQWKRDEKYFRDVTGDLITVKQAWRNPTMHIDRRYSPEEAEEILKAVRTLMQRLAMDRAV